MDRQQLLKHAKITYLPGARNVSQKPVNRLAACLVILGLLYFSVLFMSQYWRLLQLRRTLEGIEREIVIVRSQNEEMRREIEKLHSPAYVEKIARQELGMVRPGELLFFFKDTEAGD